jgi:hypothetical protein
MPYPTTEHERGVLYALNNDVDTIRGLLEHGIVEILEVGPGALKSGRRAVLQRGLVAFDQAIAEVRDQVRQQQER